ncbi:MAG: hypothetical protein ABIH21_04530 [Patescibacteria group bacterium]
MSKTPNYDSKVKEILDATEPGERVCELTGEKWQMTQEEIGWYKKFNVPPSKRSPLTRMKQLVSFYIMYQFWYQTHPETGKQFVSAIHPNSGFKALPDQEWYAKDFLDNNSVVNAQTSLLDQLVTLQKNVPLPGTKFIKEPVNSIVLASMGDVNSYFNLACRSKNSLFSVDSFDIENCSEISASTQIKNSFHVVQSHRLYKVRFALQCLDCMECDFIFDCHNCSYCFGATNKRNRQYIWFNEQLSKEDWEQKHAEVNLGCRSNLESWKLKFTSLMKEQTIFPESFKEHCTNVVGDYMNNATDCKYVVNGIDGPFRNIYYGTYLYDNSYDCAFVAAPVAANNIYCTNTAVSSANVKFCHTVKDSQNMEYCIYCYNCENCFACVGLQRKKFCILNKQYSEEGYWQKVDELKCAMLDRGEYGEPLPLSLLLVYPLYCGAPIIYMSDADEMKKLGARVYEPESMGAAGPEPDMDKVVQTNAIPDCIDGLSDEWINKPIFDEGFNRKFAFIKPEIDFYRAQKLAPANVHFVKRVLDLIQEQGSAVFFETNCSQCNKSIISTKNKHYPERKIYCRDCYLKYLEQYG